MPRRLTSGGQRHNPVMSALGQKRTYAVVPTANPTLVTIACESAEYRCDEGLVQLDLVRGGRSGPVTDGAASRNPGHATPAQCVATQIAQADGTRQPRPRGARRPVSPGTQGAGGIENHH